MNFRHSIILIVFFGCSSKSATIAQEDVDLSSGNKDWKEMLLNNITPHNNEDHVSLPINGVNLKLDLALESFYLKWSDDRLVWLPENYDGLKFFEVHSLMARFWFPEIVVADETNGAKMSGHCKVQYTGHVSCLIPGYYAETKSRCILDMTEYPYDIQKCTLTYASWSTTKDQMNVTVEPFVRSKKGRYSSEYSITSNSTSVTDFQDHLKDWQYHNRAIAVKLTFKRIDTLFAFVVRVPFVSVLLLIGLSLWLNPIRLSLRLRLMLVCLVILVFQLMYLALKFKYESSGVPFAVTTISRTLILSTILVVWYTMAHRMVYNQEMNYKFAQMLSRVKLGVLGASFPKRRSKTMAESTEDGHDEELDESFPDQHWFKLVVLVDRVFFIVFIQFVLFSRY